ncbi:MAG: hypothetical protein WEB31_02750 [Chthoniobacterales bacterium]
MNRTAVAAVIAVLGVLVLWLHREQGRGTFDGIERAFVSWLVANTGGAKPLPPLTLVLYDDEASELAGTKRLGLLDAALFARAASRLGAAAAGIEDVREDPSRMIEAAGGLPVFGGYDWRNPPGQGWTPLAGEPGATWEEAPGLAGRRGRFARGFVAPPTGASGARQILLAARNGDRAVPSFLALAWAVAHGARWSELEVKNDALTAGGARIMLDAGGAVRFLPDGVPAVLSMNEVLVASEKFEREGGDSPFRGHVMVLAPATADVARVAVEGAGEVTPAERWAAAWEAMRTNRLFLLPGWWYAGLLVAAGLVLALGPARRSNRAALVAGMLALLVFALVALGVFGSSRVLLPAAPTLLTIGAALVLGRTAHRAGWFGK